MNNDSYLLINVVGLLAAKNKKLAELREKDPNLNEKEVNFVAYVSQEAHSCGERASLLANVHVRKLEVDEEFSVRGLTLEKAIQEDREKGLIPFYVNLLKQHNIHNYPNFLNSI